MPDGELRLSTALHQHRNNRTQETGLQQESSGQQCQCSLWPRGVRAQTDASFGGGEEDLEIRWQNGSRSGLQTAPRDSVVLWITEPPDRCQHATEINIDLVDLDLTGKDELEVKATGIWDHLVDYRNLISLCQLGKLD
ncbi:hypothetical protein LEMLEM_LOCUS16810 [Lemmus lemmus]